MPKSVFLFFLLAPLAYGCASTGGELVEPSAASAEDSAAERWQCRNDLEISCGEGACKGADAGSFTPMSIDFDDRGAMSVCAYSGCWEGTGEVLENDRFLVLVGRELEFSTARAEKASTQSILISLDRDDHVASLKAGTFAHPLLCQKAGGSQ